MNCEECKDYLTCVCEMNLAGDEKIERPKTPEPMENYLDETIYSISKKIRSQLSPGWIEFFDTYDDTIKHTSELVERLGGDFIPRRENVFNAFLKTPLESIKVVIWGQDPYPQILDGDVPRAQGYSFGVAKGDSIPSSLNNIFKEISDNIPNFEQPSHGDLTRWCEQGVFLCNSALTTVPGKAGEHNKAGVWEPFINSLIKFLNEKQGNAIHVLWGKNAQALKNRISKKSTILESGHPSGFSYTKYFKGNKHFKLINIKLRKMGLEEIDWNLN